MHNRLPLMSIIFFSRVLRLPSKIKVNLALGIISLGISIYLIEVGLFLGGVKPYSTPSLQQRMMLAQQQGIPYDARTRLQVIKDLQNQGVDVFSRISPSHFIKSNGIDIDEELLYPLGGIANQQTVHCNESGEWIIFTSDEHGFRNPQGFYKSQDLNIVLVGDSFAFGACVEKNVGDRLRQKGRSVLNLGYSGIGPLIELAILSEFGASFTPDTVLWLYFEGNDLEDLSRERESPILMKYLDRNFSQSLLERQPEVDEELIEFFKSEAGKAQLVSAPGAAWTCVVKLCGWRALLSVQNVISSSVPLPLFGQILTEANNRVAVWGGELYFVYLPSWERYSGVPGWDKASHREDVLSLVRELKIPVIDFHEVAAAQPNPLLLFPFGVHGHYTAEAYQLLAEQIDAYLMADTADLFGEERLSSMQSGF